MTLFVLRREFRVGEIHLIHQLILVDARKDKFFLPGVRVDVSLEALCADGLHHALHRRVDGCDGNVTLFQVLLKHAAPRSGHGSHHPVRPDRDDPVCLAQRNRLIVPMSPSRTPASPGQCCRRMFCPAAALRPECGAPASTLYTTRSVHASISSRLKRSSLFLYPAK